MGMYRTGFGICGTDSGEIAEIRYELYESCDVTEGGEMSCVMLCDTVMPLDVGCSVAECEKNGTKLNGCRKDGF
jgi:hypothetical protein